MEAYSKSETKRSPVLLSLDRLLQNAAAISNQDKALEHEERARYFKDEYLISKLVLGEIKDSVKIHAPENKVFCLSATGRLAIEIAKVYDGIIEWKPYPGTDDYPKNWFDASGGTPKYEATDIYSDLEKIYATLADTGQEGLRLNISDSLAYISFNLVDKVAV